jgi:choline kinase
MREIRQRGPLAVILAAGRGGRLRQVAGERPKCLVRIGECTLIERQIRTLRSCGIEDIVVVAGFRAADVRRACGPRIKFVSNPRFASTNSLYSLWLARNLLMDGFVVLNCDVLFHAQLLTDLLTARYDDALLMCPRGEGAGYGDEEMKVRVRGGLVAAIAKTLDTAEADGENVGIAKFGAAGAAQLVAEMNAIVAANGVHEWLPRAFDAFCRRRALHVVGTRGFPWIEIDFPEDYWRACSEVLPAIDLEFERRPAPIAVPRAVAVGRTGRTQYHV